MSFMRVTRSGSFHLPVAPSRAFPFFTPEGERAWAPGWEPTYFQDDSTPQPGLAFQTAAGGELTLWLVIRYDPDQYEAQYARIVPGSRLGTVTVRCAPAADESSRVTVTYDLTAISDAGNRILEELTPDAYAAMLRDWEESITRAVARATPPRSTT